MSKFNKLFENMAKIHDRSVIWNDFLDYCIYLNVIDNRKKELKLKGSHEQYGEMLAEWLLQLEKDLETKPYSDMLGHFYEELVTSHSKSKSIGQFYTPTDVTNLMVDLCINEDSSGMVNDCACGSARMLLSAHVKSKGNLFCIGQDLDEVSCKMAVLNFWSHGVRGSILHQNTLTTECYQAWRVNNYLYHGLPIPHIEVVSPRDAYHFIGLPRGTEPVEINNSVIENYDVKKETVQTKLM